MPGVNVTNAVSFYKILASSVGRAKSVRFIKLEVAGSKLIFFFFFLSFFFFFFIIIVILDYCKVDYKVFIFVNNVLIYLSRMESCL